MEEKNNPNFVRTTLYLSRKLHDEAKIMAVLTHTSMSRIVSVSLREKIDQLHKEYHDKHPNKS